MQFLIGKTDCLAGEVIIPSSKSQTIRGLIISLLANGRSILRQPLDSEDTHSALKVCQDLGAEIKRGVKEKWVIKSRGTLLKEQKSAINTGNSGITTNFILPALGLREKRQKQILLNCGEQMHHRPVQPMISALNSLGMNIISENNNSHYPLKISGELRGGKTEIDGFVSQYTSGLLLSLPLAPNNSELSVENLRERPYIEMTLAWLDEQQVRYEHQRKNNKDIFKIKGRHHYKPIDEIIPADFSSASYFIAAGALMPKEIILKNLDMDDKQGDKQLIYILQEMGADIGIGDSQIKIQKGGELKGRKIDCCDIPDLMPTLAVIGTQSEGATELFNIEHTQIKETNRIASMVDGLRRLGARIEEKKDSLKIYQSDLRGARVAGYGDHRTVMALTLAGLLAEGQTIIDTAESVSKTFPNFAEALKSIGAQIDIIN